MGYGVGTQWSKRSNDSVSHHTSHKSVRLEPAVESGTAGCVLRPRVASRSRSRGRDGGAIAAVWDADQWTVGSVRGHTWETQSQNHPRHAGRNYGRFSGMDSYSHMGATAKDATEYCGSGSSNRHSWGSLWQDGYR